MRKMSFKKVNGVTKMILYIFSNPLNIEDQNSIVSNGGGFRGWVGVVWYSQIGLKSVSNPTSSISPF